jgi:hypothetical protein
MCVCTVVHHGVGFVLNRLGFGRVCVRHRSPTGEKLTGQDLSIPKMPASLFGGTQLDPYDCIHAAVCVPPETRACITFVVCTRTVCCMRYANGMRL